MASEIISEDKDGEKINAKSAIDQVLIDLAHTAGIEDAYGRLQIKLLLGINIGTSSLSLNFRELPVVLVTVSHEKAGEKEGYVLRRYAFPIKPPYDPANGVCPSKDKITIDLAARKEIFVKNDDMPNEGDVREIETHIMNAIRPVLYSGLFKAATL